MIVHDFIKILEWIATFLLIAWKIDPSLSAVIWLNTNSPIFITASSWLLALAICRWTWFSISISDALRLSAVITTLLGFEVIINNQLYCLGILFNIFIEIYIKWIIYSCKKRKANFIISIASSSNNTFNHHFTFLQNLTKLLLSHLN